MDENIKIWKASVWIGADEDEPITIYENSIGNLRGAICNWIIENQPEKFGNAHPSYELTRRYNYSHASTDNPVRIQTSYDHYKEITEGWVGVDGNEKDWSVYYLFDDVESVATHFVNQSMIVYKGPDWKEIPDDVDNFPLHKIKTVKRVTNELELNDHLQRGWYLLSLEFSGEVDHNIQLVHRQATFVIGHSEEDIEPLPATASETYEKYWF